MNARYRGREGDGSHSIRKIRRARGLTIMQTVDRLRAAGCRISVGGLSMIERGETRYTQRTIEGLAVALECSPSELVAPEVTPEDRAREDGA